MIKRNKKIVCNMDSGLGSAPHTLKSFKKTLKDTCLETAKKGDELYV
jgi:hypothetical protein